MITISDGRLEMDIEMRNGSYNCEKEILERYLTYYNEVTMEYKVTSILAIINAAYNWRANIGEYYDDEYNCDNRQLTMYIFER